MEATLTEELSPEENFFFPLKSVQFADDSDVLGAQQVPDIQVSFMKHLYASSFNHFPQ